MTNQWVNAGGVPVSPQPNISLTSGDQTWSRTIRTTRYSMAWALMAGFGVQISPSATLDFSYRYLNAGTTNLAITPQTGATVKMPDVSQDFRIGVRYMAD